MVNSISGIFVCDKENEKTSTIYYVHCLQECLQDCHLFNTFFWNFHLNESYKISNNINWYDKSTTQQWDVEAVSIATYNPVNNSFSNFLHGSYVVAHAVSIQRFNSSKHFQLSHRDGKFSSKNCPHYRLVTVRGGQTTLKTNKQAGAELGQAHPQLGMSFIPYGLFFAW